VIEMPELPDFDSLPATAGLSNTEAFQMSIRHALTLLRTSGFQFAAADDCPDGERFSLR
jgi:hypothetical protein